MNVTSVPVVPDRVDPALPVDFEKNRSRVSTLCLGGDSRTSVATATPAPALTGDHGNPSPTADRRRKCRACPRTPGRPISPACAR